MYLGFDATMLENHRRSFLDIIYFGLRGSDRMVVRNGQII